MQGESWIEQIVKIVMVSRPVPYNEIVRVPPGLLAFQTQRKLLWPRPGHTSGVYSMSVK